MDHIINNCKWAFRCPKTWQNLSKTVNSTVRFCNECQKNVFLCESEEEVAYHSNRLNCIYIQPSDPNEIKYEFLGKYLPSEYFGPTMRIILAPTFSINNDQVKFLVRSFDLGKFELNWKEILCDGKEHILKTKIPPAIAESLMKRLEDRNISYRMEIEPD